MNLLLLLKEYHSNRLTLLTHDGRKTESEAQGQGHLAGHAAPVLGLSEEDDGAEEGHHQREEQRESQQGIIGFHQRSAKVQNKHHLGNKNKAGKQTIFSFSVSTIGFVLPVSPRLRW